MTVTTLKDLFVHTLPDVHNAGKQLIKIVPKLVKSAEHEGLIEESKDMLE